MGLPARPPVPCPSCGVAAERCLWPGWMPVMEKWLAEASFLLRLLMAPSIHPKRIREASPEFRTVPDRGGCHHLNVTSRGFSSPGCRCASLAPWPGSKIALEESVPRVRASGTTAQESSWLDLLVEARLKGDPGNLRRVLRPRLPQRWLREVPGAWAVGSTRKLWTDRSAEEGHAGKNQNEPQAFLGKSSTAGSRNF